MFDLSLLPAFKASAAAGYIDKTPDPDEFFKMSNAADRVLWAKRKYDDKVAVSTSFGVHSLLMLQLAKMQNVPVVCADIQDEKHNQQRTYGAFLKEAMGFELHTFQAENEAGKVRALQEGLRSLGANVMLSGIRNDQTDHRANRKFLERHSDGIIHIHPILNWQAGQVEGYIEKMPIEWRHPDYKPGARSTGGVILAEDQEKIECGIHLDLGEGI